VEDCASECSERLVHAREAEEVSHQRRKGALKDLGAHVDRRGTVAGAATTRRGELGTRNIYIDV